MLINRKLARLWVETQQTGGFRTEPQYSFPVLNQFQIIRVHAFQPGSVSCKRTRCRIETIQTIISGCPERTIVINEKAGDDVIAQAVRIPRIVLEPLEKRCSRVEAEKSMAIGAHPEVAGAILANCDYIGSLSCGGEAKGIVSLCFAVDSIKRFVGADPQDPLTVLVNRPNKRFIPAGRIAEIVAISLEWQGPGGKTRKSEAAQTSPNDPLLICEHSTDAVLGQALRIGKAIAIANESPMFPVKFKQARTVG